MSDKIYVGSGKVVKTNFGELTKLSFSEEDINKMRQNLNERGYVNLVLKQKQNPMEGKPTHYMEVDTWKPAI